MPADLAYTRLGLARSLYLISYTFYCKSEPLAFARLGLARPLYLVHYTLYSTPAPLGFARPRLARSLYLIVYNQSMRVLRVRGSAWSDLYTVYCMHHTLGFSRRLYLISYTLYSMPSPLAGASSASPDLYAIYYIRILVL